MHKEFKFTPNMLTLTVAEGTNPEVKLEGSRVAYSATGTVRLLDGNPEKSVIIFARALDGSGNEEATTDVNGDFRIRGLKPGVQYAVSVKSGSTTETRHERGSPAEVTITMGNGDYEEGLSFLAFRKQKLLDLHGAVEVPWGGGGGGGGGWVNTWVGGWVGGWLGGCNFMTIADNN
jgi:hypothetical protein